MKKPTTQTKQIQPRKAVETWNDMTNNWQSIPIAAYALMLCEAKARQDSQQKECIDIAEKSFKLFQLFIIFLTGVAGLLVKANIVTLKFSDKGFSVGLFFTIIGFLVFYLLLSTRHDFVKGSSPKDMLVADVYDPKYNEEDKLRYLYFHELGRYQYSTSQLTKDIKIRQSLLRLVYLFTIVSFMYCVLLGIDLILPKLIAQ